MSSSESVRVCGDHQTFFVGVGAAKSGTTWLGQQLAHHPDVWMPVDKEIHYFDARHIATAKFFRRRKYERLVNQLTQHDWPKLSRNPDLMAETQWLARQALVADPDDQWYVDLFAHTAATHRVVGEITPAYAALPKEGFAHIASMAPEVKVLFIMRDPVERLWSAARYFSGNHPDEPVTGYLDHLLAFADRAKIEANSRYDSTVTNLKAVFPENQLHIMFYEDCFASAAAAEQQLGSVCKFLGLDATKLDPAPKNRRINPSPAADLPEEWREALRRRYKPVVDDLEETLGYVPPSWK